MKNVCIIDEKESTISFITTHAINKYRQITNLNLEQEQIEKKILKDFYKSSPEKIGPGIVRRIIDNNFEEAWYFLLGNIRFTICKNDVGEYFIKTIEEDFFRDKTPSFIKKSTVFGSRGKR